MQTNLFDDICANKHGGAETSKLANRKATKERDRETVLTLIRRHGGRGITLHEVGDLMGKPANTISGRFTELRANGKIFHQGKRDYRGHLGRIYFPFHFY